MKSIVDRFDEMKRKAQYGDNVSPPADSNWHLFAQEFDVGVLDLDGFASLMGAFNDSFLQMDRAITPYDLYKRDPALFSQALRESSLKASDMSDEEIADKVLNLWPHEEEIASPENNPY